MLIDSPTELTTAATDLLLALAALVLAYDQRRVAGWRNIFLFLALAAGLGALAHGLVLSERAKSGIWFVTYGALALLVMQFALVVLTDLSGRPVPRAGRIGLWTLAVGFWLYSGLFATSFLPFIIYEVLAMGFALAGFGWLALRGQPGRAWLALGVVITLGAAAIQALKLVTFTFIWPFDHNGVYHLVQLLALLPFWLGLRAMARSPM